MKIITGTTGTEHVTSDDDRALYAGIFGAGSYILNTGMHLSASVETANTIRLHSGDLVHHGTHARIPYGEYEDVTIDNGTTGYNRKDLIVARYIKEAGMEKMELAVIKGTPSAAEALVPGHEEGNILENDEVVDMPLYVVTLSGVNVSVGAPLCRTISATLDKLYTQAEVTNMVNTAKTEASKNLADVSAQFQKTLDDETYRLDVRMDEKDKRLTADIAEIQTKLNNLDTGVTEIITQLNSRPTTDAVANLVNTTAASLTQQMNGIKTVISSKHSDVTW